ncbi:MAG TPA: hypothetical protein VGR32_10160 [Brevundimonas sp.]|jgi:hypothetical protein|uniref:hypothetical protein n=1 Tax=Brevundimonas sp. TaxID=1871086 RepID=UPI002DEB57AB|nr:hypothetical protein [Brevundimonas sp.]
MSAQTEPLDRLVEKLEAGLRGRGYTERSIRDHRRKTRELAAKYLRLTVKEAAHG